MDNLFLVTVVVLTLVLGVVFIDEFVESKRSCDSFKDMTIQYIPARCLAYFHLSPLEK